jgi:hypothetical protein
MRALDVDVLLRLWDRLQVQAAVVLPAASLTAADAGTADSGAPAVVYRTLGETPTRGRIRTSLASPRAVSGGRRQINGDEVTDWLVFAA